MERSSFELANEILKQDFTEIIRDHLNSPLTFASVAEKWEKASRLQRTWWRLKNLVWRVRHRLGHWIIGGACFWCGTLDDD